MFQRDIYYYSVGYKLSDVEELLNNWKTNHDKGILVKICEANKRRFERYFEVFDYYFMNREDVFLKDASIFDGKFNLSHDFIIMSNICSIIETYYQFNHGEDQSPSGNTVACYKWVFEERLLHRSSSYSRENAVLFYKRIRNGLVHQTNTDIKAALSDCNNPIMIDGDGFLLCNTKLIYEHLRESIMNYFEYMPTKSIESEIVNNLIIKTSYILRLSSR